MPRALNDPDGCGLNSSLGSEGGLAVVPDHIDARRGVERVGAVAAVEDVPGSVICLMGRAPAYEVVTGTSVDSVPPEASFDPVVAFLPENLVAAVAAAAEHPVALAGAPAIMGTHLVHSERRPGGQREHQR